MSTVGVNFIILESLSGRYSILGNVTVFLSPFSAMFHGAVGLWGAWKLIAKFDNLPCEWHYNQLVFRTNYDLSNPRVQLFWFAYDAAKMIPFIFNILDFAVAVGVTYVWHTARNAFRYLLRASTTTGAREQALSVKQEVAGARDIDRDIKNCSEVVGTLQSPSELSSDQHAEQNISNRPRQQRKTFIRQQALDSKVFLAFIVGLPIFRALHLFITRELSANRANPKRVDLSILGSAFSRLWLA